MFYGDIIDAMPLGKWLSLIGGVLEFVAVCIATYSAWRGYTKVRTRVGILRGSLDRYRARVAEGADQKAASAELAEYRQQHGLEPEATWDDIWYIKTLITYLISRSAALSAGLTVGFLFAGIVLSTLGNLLAGSGT